MDCIVLRAGGDVCALASNNLEKSLLIAARSILQNLERVIAATETTVAIGQIQRKDEAVIRASLSGQPPLELSGPSGGERPPLLWSLFH